MPPPATTRPDEDTLRSLVSQGKSDSELAARFGVTRHTVMAWRKQHGIASCYKPRRASRRQATGTKLPPREGRFTYELDGECYVLRAPMPVVAAAEKAFERIHGEE